MLFFLLLYPQRRPSLDSVPETSTTTTTATCKITATHSLPFPLYLYLFICLFALKKSKKQIIVISVPNLCLHLHLQELKYKNICFSSSNNSLSNKSILHFIHNKLNGTNNGNFRKAMGFKRKRFESIVANTIHILEKPIQLHN